MEISEALAALSTNAPAEEEEQTLAERQGVDQETFLRIFLAQLEHQDPLNPQDTAQMSAQLAQFSQLEQALKTTDALGDIGSKLDQLIELQGGGDAVRSTLDPLSMLGRQVDFLGDSLTAPVSGASPLPLTFDLDQGADAVSLMVRDPLGLVAAWGELVPLDENGDPVPFPPGNYELHFRDDQMRIAAPDGSEFEITFARASIDENGNVVVDPEGGPYEFSAGDRYRFEAVAAVQGASIDLDLLATGTVDAIRIAGNRQVLSILGQEVDPTTIIRIR